MRERFIAAKAAGVEVVRLAPNKWLNGRPKSELGDFLIGRPGSFSALNQDDLARLLAVLNDAQAAKMKVVLTMLSLPGHRWRQHNAGVQERRLWEDWKSQEQAIACWRLLAAALKSHPAIVGCNILNEPSPERAAIKLADWHTDDYELWYWRVQGTPADLNFFYQKVVQAIRQVDGDTPIMLDSGFYATPWAFKILRPVQDDKVIYSFHFYEPFAYTSRENGSKFSYPGRIPVGERADGNAIQWNQEQMESFLQPVVTWQKKYVVPAHRILVGEVGVYRFNNGAARYLDDALSVFSQHGWHWAFYSFREDDWHGMDYELGTNKPPAAYWQAIESGRLPDVASYRPNALFEVIRQKLRSPSQQHPEKN